MKRPHSLEELHAYCTALEEQNAELKARLQLLEEQFRPVFRTLGRHKFGFFPC